MLEGDGQLVRMKGRGTFVAPRKTTDRIRGLTRTLAGPVPPSTTIHVLDAYEQTPEPYVARTLGVRESARVAHVTTLTCLGGRPLLLRDSFVAQPLARPVLDAVRSGTVAMRETPPIDAELGRAQVAIQTSFCSEFEAEQLEIAAGGLVILIRCVERDAGGRPIEMARIVYRADIVELAAELV
jgi:GntR family transcriptional regulator